MKRYFLTAAAIAISSLGLAAPGASAAGESKTYQVPFTGIAASVCVLDAGIVAGGTLTNLDNSAQLTTLTPGLVTYLCNDDTTASVGTPVQTDISLAGETITGDLDASIGSVLNNGVDLGLTAALGADINVLPGLNVVSVEMVATDNDGTIKAGDYSFEVPLTITCL